MTHLCRRAHTRTNTHAHAHTRAPPPRSLRLAPLTDLRELGLCWEGAAEALAAAAPPLALARVTRLELAEAR